MLPRARAEGHPEGGLLRPERNLATVAAFTQWGESSGAWNTSHASRRPVEGGQTAGFGCRLTLPADGPLLQGKGQATHLVALQQRRNRSEQGAQGISLPEHRLGGLESVSAAQG